ncbi:hypothetical protein ABPG74_016652 [Tetrahymena malaccensis]
MTNYQLLYEQEKDFRIQLQEEYDEFKTKSQEIEEYLEKEITNMMETLDKKDKEVSDLKSKLSQNKAESDKFIRQLEREVDILKQKYEQLQENHKKDKIKLVQLENEVEYLESQNRALETLNSDLEQKIDSILEELALLQTELEENKNNHQRDIENIERLKQQIRDTESELFAQQMKHQMLIDNQENNKNLSNFSSRNMHQYYSNNSNASTSSTSSHSASQTVMHNNLQSELATKNVTEIEDSENHQYKQRQIKRVRTGAQNQTYSFNQQQVEQLSKIYTKTLNESKFQQQAGNDGDLQKNSNNNVNNSISEKDSSSNNSSGKKDESDIFQADQKNQQRGRKLTSFTTLKTERYSEEKRRLQHKIIKDKISMYDNNISNLKITQLGFSKSLNLITNLINDMNDKMVKIRNKKAQLGTPRNLSSAQKKIQISVN